MKPLDAEYPTWQLAHVTSPHLAQPIPVVAARYIAYRPDANRFQNLSIYLPKNAETSSLVGSTATSLPEHDSRSSLPRSHVHIHGGAWRDPQLTSGSIEPAVAHAFSAAEVSTPITAVASINYTISQFPTHPTLPYDTTKDNHSDPAREATHPQHVSDVLHGLALLRSFGLTDHSYILSGHSAGATLAFQATLQPPWHYGLQNIADAPCPAALLGLNGLYDLCALVDGLGASHEHLRVEYEVLLGYAFGADKSKWVAASPACFDPTEIAQRVRARKVPQIAVLDQSDEDQLVPMNQRDRMVTNLSKVDGLRVVEGFRCTGVHAAPWEEGIQIWHSLQDVFNLLKDQSKPAP